MWIRVRSKKVWIRNTPTLYLHAPARPAWACQSQAESGSGDTAHSPPHHRTHHLHIQDYSLVSGSSQSSSPQDPPPAHTGLKLSVRQLTVLLTTGPTTCTYRTIALYQAAHSPPHYRTHHLHIQDYSLVSSSSQSSSLQDPPPAQSHIWIYQSNCYNSVIVAWLLGKKYLTSTCFPYCTVKNTL